MWKLSSKIVEGRYIFFVWRKNIIDLLEQMEVFHVKIKDNSVSKDCGKICKETVEKLLLHQHIQSVWAVSAVPEWCQVLQMTQVTEEYKRNEQREKVGKSTVRERGERERGREREREGERERERERGEGSVAAAVALSHWGMTGNIL